MAKQAYTREIVVGVVTAIVTALLLWLGGAIGTRLSDADHQTVANRLHNSDDFKKLLIDSLKNEPSVKGEKGDSATGADTAKAIFSNESLRTELETAVSKRLSEQLGNQKAELKALTAQLNAPAARFEQTTVGQPVDTSSPARPVGTVIEFNHRYYDTHGGYEPKTPWRYKVQEDGYYNVTAFAACAQSGGRLSLGLCVDGKPGNQRPTVFFAESQAYTSGTIIGGTTDIELRKGQLIDIRVYAGAVSASKLVAIGTTHVSIHYVRSLPK